MVPGLTSYVAPTVAATTLALTDDSAAVVLLGSAFPFPGGSTTSLQVSSNGFVSAAVGNAITGTTAYTPDAATLLSAPQTAWRCAWHDLNPAAVGSGQVKFEEVGTTSYVTWDGVYDFTGTTAANANTFQAQFDRATGNVHLVWQTMSTLGGTGFGVGYSPGGASANPGNTDISVALPATFSTASADVSPLTLAAGSRPILNTNVALTTTNIPAGSPIAVTILSFGQVNPGVDLGFLGAPGCRQHVTPGSNTVFVAPAGSTVLNLFIPNVPAFVGMLVFGQAASISPGVNALNVLTSNGVALSIGDV
jgi:hypothetical protein